MKKLEISASLSVRIGETNYYRTQVRRDKLELSEEGGLATLTVLIVRTFARRLGSRLAQCRDPK